VQELRRSAHAIHGEADDYDGLVELARDRPFVLIGESSHGTADFYRERARITQRLVEDLGFVAVGIEGDWPDADRVHRYVTGRSDVTDAPAALAGFERFPSWMWRNTEVQEFVEWLRAWNDARAPSTKVGFYGLDLYSLRASMLAVVEYLDRVDPAEASRARERYACFDHVGGEGQAYGYALATSRAITCEDEVVAQLVQLRNRSEAYLRRNGLAAEEDFFAAEQNAVVVRDAEEYYQQMFRAGVSSWNLRDLHMAETLDALATHLSHRLDPPRIVVWEHNSHVGDARATEMQARGEHTVGQLVRQRYLGESLLVGFTTYDGTVTAARDWGGQVERRWVRPAMPGSHEAFLHDLGFDRAWFDTSEPAVRRQLGVPRLQRAIGVVYRPETERASHYLHSRLAEEFDVVVHLDHTEALVPLDRTEVWDEGEPAETFPSGL
jgi:erythromycin esterase-like protein